MADNVDITPGTGKTIATDDIAGVQYQRVKVTYGTDGNATDASSSNPLPVTIAAAATAIAKAEDAAHVTGDVGVPLLAVRKATAANLSDADGDYEPLQMSAGALWVNTSLGKAEDAAHASGDTGVMALTVRQDSVTATAGTDGDYQPASTDATGRLWVRPAPVQVRIQNTPTISSGAAYTSGDVVGGLQELANAARVSGGSGIIQSITVLDKTQAQRAAMDLLFFDRTVTVAADNAAVATSDADMVFCLGVVSIGPYNTAWPGTPLNSVSTLLNVGLPFVLNGTSLFVVAVVRGTPTYTSTSDLVFSYTILQD